MPEQVEERTSDSENTTAFLSGKLAQVDIMRIERELKSLWRSATESGEGHLVTRACAMNLVLYSEDDDAETAAGNILDDITTRHPCRAILAIRRAFEHPRLEAWVSARCHLTDSKTRKQICCEQITVLSEGTGPHELASVVLPLVIPDLPVHLWWRTAGLDIERMEPFLGAIDELIVDSAQDSDAGDYLYRLAELLDTDQARHLVAVSDLNWRRTYTFREGLALSFSRVQETIPEGAFANIKRVEIHYAASKECDQSVSSSSSSNQDTARLNRALLYLGWLASRLAWRPETINKKSASSDRLEIEFAVEAQAKNGKNGKSGSSNQSGAAKIARCERLTAELVEVSADDSCSGALLSVAVEFADETIPSLSLFHQNGTPGVQVHYGDEADGKSESQRRQNHFTLTEASESRIIDDELESTHRDPSFEPALTAAVQIKRLIEQPAGKSGA